MSIFPTGFCWECGRLIRPLLKTGQVAVIENELFCLSPRQCEEKYYRKQKREIKTGKRASYGVTGSMH